MSPVRNVLDLEADGIAIGILGAFVASWLFGMLGIGLRAGSVGGIVMATVGAVVLLFAVGLVKKLAN